MVAWAQLHAAESVPNTLLEASAALDMQLTAADRTSFKGMAEQEAVSRAHLGLGMYIRNEWFHSGRSDLPKSLQVLHLDDASSIVLTSYWRHLNGKPLEVERQISCFHRWWKEQHRLIAKAKAKGSSSYETPRFSCP